MEFKRTKGNWTVRENATIFSNGTEHKYLEIITDYRLSENHINTIAKLPLEKAKNTLFNCISELPESYQGAVREQAEMCKYVIKKATRI